MMHLLLEKIPASGINHQKISCSEMFRHKKALKGQDEVQTPLYFHVRVWLNLDMLFFPLHILCQSSFPCSTSFLHLE